MGRLVFDPKTATFLRLDCYPQYDFLVCRSEIGQILLRLLNNVAPKRSDRGVADESGSPRMPTEKPVCPSARVLPSSTKSVLNGLC